MKSTITSVNCNGKIFSFKKESKDEDYNEYDIDFTLLLDNEWVARSSVTKVNDIELCVLDELGVNVNYQRQMIGSCFLDEIKKECLSIKVNAEPRAFVFYEKNGFSPSFGRYDREYLNKIRELSENEDFDKLSELWNEYGGIDMYY